MKRDVLLTLAAFLLLTVLGLLGWLVVDVRVGGAAPETVMRVPLPGCETVHLELDARMRPDSVRIYPAIGRCPSEGTVVTGVLYRANRVIGCAGACDTVPGWRP